jgi:antitoxin component YwqK of YwqJK toxin-antitoxin module
MLTDNLKYLDSPNQKMETGKRIVIGQYRVKDLSETFDKYENEWSWGGTYDFRSYPLAYSEIDNVDGNGSIVLWYPNGRIKEKINYIELQKDGEFISYYRNGKIESKGNYEQNIKVGQWEYHFENNDNNYIVNYTQGQMEELTYYDAINSEFTDGPKNYTGVPVYKWNTEVPPSRRKDVSFDNLYIIQNNKNKSFSFNNYPDRIFNKGTQVSFSVSGKITMLIDKVNGDDNSFKSTNYYDNGTIKSEIGFIYEDEKFVNVIWHGRQVTFSENGQQLTDFYFKDGRWDKKQTAWYENGQKWYEYYNKDGIRVGTSIYWHENGQKDIEGEYRDGKRQGAWTQWKPNGQKQTEGEYLDGKPEGVWKEYDADGKVSEIDYNSGIFALQKEFEKSQKLKSNKMESSNNNNCDGNYFWSNNELELSIRIRGEKYSSTMIMYSGFGRIYDEENAERGSGWVKDCELYLNDGPMSNVSIGRVKVNDLIWDGLGITLDKQ